MMIRKFFYRSFLGCTCALLSILTWAVQPSQLVKDARSQIGRTLYYDPAYIYCFKVSYG